MYKALVPLCVNIHCTCTLVAPPLSPSLLLQVAQWQLFMSTTQLDMTQYWRSYAADSGPSLELPPVSNLLAHSVVHLYM